ncbi:MAG: hypothetical protein WAU58_03075 [Terriglobales bacterium]
MIRKIENIWHQIVHLNVEMEKFENPIFAEQYRVVAVATDRLQVQGILSGDVLTIINPEPECPLTQEDYPLGKLISLTDPSAAPQN